MDNLSPVIERLALSAHTFFAGTLCNNVEFCDASGPGHLHLVRKGPLTLQISDAQIIQITEPSLVLIAPPLPHQLKLTNPESAELVCAEISLVDGSPGASGSP